MSAQRDRGWRNELADHDGIDPSTSTTRVETRPLLVGNNIENPGNTAGLRAAAEMFDWDCGFLNDARHPAAQTATAVTGSRIISLEELAACGAPIIALENASGADDLYRLRPPKGRFVVVAGNERKGIASELLRLADRVVQIPISSAHLNTVNVAAAAAIALHHLSRAGGGAIARGAGARPAVLLAGPTDAIATGSVIRSAACFGWTRLFLEDVHDVWFETDRVTRSLGRGAARRGRNPIRVIPARGGTFDEVCVLSTRGDGEPLRRADLTLGPTQLVVIPDERDGEVDEHRWARLGLRLRRVRIDTARGTRPPFRLVASIALAEIARQIGGWCRPGEARLVRDHDSRRRHRR